MKYSFGYKCRICEEIVYIGETETNRENIVSQLNKTLSMEQYMNGITGDKKMITIHNCSSGSVGFADLIGAKRI